METQNSTRASSLGVAYALGAYGIWGFAPMYWRALESIPAAQLLAHRVWWSMVVGVALLLLTRRVGELRVVLRSRRRLLPMLFSALLIGTNWLVFLYAVETDRVLDTSLGYYINPLISVLMGTLLLGEKLRPWQIAAVSLAALGVLWLTLSFGELPWISLVLAFSFALYGLVRKLAPVMPVVGFTLETAILAPLGLAYLLFVRAEGSDASADATFGFRLLIVGTGAFTAVPLLCFNSAAKRLKLSTVGLFQYIAPSISFVLAVALYGEPFTRAHTVAFACVWLALAIYSLDSLRAARGI
ncbi:MAG: EamA family transporter RarD [Deltaproteobacteria bacterium]|nr:EamA family transporter RarD [Deltaproteobacteria bacterium]MBW2665256.1 EamA family transporter RarD [Deltaproteobacteria bacterium]